MTLSPSSIRLDLKCGKGAISKGEKCHKGAASAGSSKRRMKAPKEASFAEKGLIALGTAAAIGGLATSKFNKTGNSITRERGYQGVAVAGGGLGLIGTGLGLYGQRTNNETAKAIGAGTALMGYGLAGVGHIGIKEEQKHRQRLENIKNMNFSSPDWSRAREQARSWGASEQARQSARNWAGTGYQNRSQGSAGSQNYNWAGTGANRRTRPNSAVKDPFKDLGVSSNASDAEIKAKWLNLMRQNHPDAGGDPAKATQINAAYQEILRRRGRRDSIWATGFTMDWAGL